MKRPCFPHTLSDIFVFVSQIFFWVFCVTYSWITSFKVYFLLFYFPRSTVQARRAENHCCHNQWDQLSQTAAPTEGGRTECH